MCKACWRVLLPDGQSFSMVGEKCTEAEARAFARGIWRSAEVQ